MICNNALIFKFLMVGETFMLYLAVCLADRFNNALCDGLVGVHIVKLIFEGRASRVDYQYVHKLFSLLLDIFQLFYYTTYYKELQGKFSHDRKKRSRFRYL